MHRFGEKLRALRMKHGMTVRELAHALGYTAHSHVGEVEMGRQKPSIDFALKVSRLFNVTMDQLCIPGVQAGLTDRCTEPGIKIGAIRHNNVSRKGGSASGSSGRYSAAFRRSHTSASLYFPAGSSPYFGVPRSMQNREEQIVLIFMQ